MVQDGIKTAYAYDALGQLIRVDDGQENATWLYTYDNGGNIRSKQKFALGVTTGEPLESKHFSYSNDAWRDQLTAVDGVAITYDAIGNPLSDGTWSYTWQNGRQLQKMQKQGETVEFVYNENGLRVQKTATSTGVTKYTLHGKNVVHMTQGEDELHFFYDAQNRPAVVVYNGTAYAYVKSLQGDIVAILDENGNTVVSYGYDAWGAPLWCTGELAETLGNVQPFRYRGYVFDEETGLYYLKSRYFNSAICRFISSDVFFEKINSANSQNIYTYCHNETVVKYDKNGNASDSCITLFVEGSADVKIDITERLNQTMEEGYNEISKYCMEHGLAETIVYFVENVKTGGKWDLKNRANWNLRKGETYIYNDIPLRWDEPGNISFGYIGSAIFGTDVLQLGAGMYQIMSGTSYWGYVSSYGDDPLDSMCIQYGYLLKNQVRFVYMGVTETLEEFEIKFKEVHQ